MSVFGRSTYRRLKLDVVAVAPELAIRSVRPWIRQANRDIVKNLVDDIVGDDVEEVLAINEVTSAPRTRSK